MTTVEDITKDINHAPPAGRRWLPDLSKLGTALYDTLVIGAATFVAGGVVSAVLEEPVNTKLIPAVLELVGHHQRIEIIKQTADGKVVVASCYQLLVPPWSRSVSGRMVEITDPKLCAAVPGEGEEETPVQFKTDGAWGGNVMSVAFSHFNGEFGGGSFSADAMNTPGVYIGSMQAQAHDAKERCMLTHFWVVVGKPERQPYFQKMLEDRITGQDGRVAMLAQPVSGGQCKADQKTADASGSNARN